jgi:hypothetical protein
MFTFIIILLLRYWCLVINSCSSEELLISNVIKKDMPGSVPRSWPDLIGYRVQDAILIIHKERPDLRGARVLPPNVAPTPPAPGDVRVVIYNDSQHIVIPPAPYIG